MRMRIKPMVKDFIHPVYKTAGAAAFDIFLQQDLTLTPNEPVTIKLGFATGMEDGYYAAIVPPFQRGAQVRSPPAEHHRAD